MRFDFRPPSVPAVTGLMVTSGLKSYQVTWDASIYSVSVWAATVNDRAQAVRLDTVASNSYTHITDGSQYFYWTQTVDALGRPAGDWNPLSATAGLTAMPSSVGRINIVASSTQWLVGPTGLPVNTTITLTANLLGGLSGFVTWSKSGAGTVAPEDGTTNIWQVFAADQTEDTNVYTATLTYGGVTYTDTVTLYRVRDGAKGDTGDTGQLGSLKGYGSAYGIVSTVWSSSIANRIISNMLLGESLTTVLATTTHLLPGDTVTLSDNAGFAETRFWDGDSWLVPGEVIDGNLLVNGTVAANKITAGSISTGYQANARIDIGDVTFIGTTKSPLHVSKVSAEPNQVLISAQNTKDDSAAIWGSSVYSLGNAVTGTWHARASDASAGRWTTLGVLGSNMFGAAVAGSVYNDPNQYGAWFRYFSNASDAGTQTVATEVKLATAVGGATRAIVATGKVQLFGASSSIMLGTNEGTAGQVLTSQGSGATPTWTNASGGSITYAGLQDVCNDALTTPLDLNGTFRATATTVPISGSGTELAYYSGTGFLIACTRTTGGAVSVYKPLEIQGSTIAFNVTPTCPTPATATNSTAIATTAYVKAQGYTSNAGTVTSFAFTNGNGITGTVSNATTTPTLSFSIGALTGTSFNSITGLATATPIVAGTGAVGTSTKAAREDHVHPAQTASVTYAGIQTACVGTTGSALNLTTTFRATGTNVPTFGAGIELAYNAGEGFLIACTRAADGSVSSYSPLQIQGSTITLNVTPTFPTPTTSDNSTKGATTAFVKAQGYTANAGTVTNFSFTNGSGITGSVSNAGTTPTLSLSLGALTGTSFNSITGLSSATPAAPTTSGTVGSSTMAARADHAHPKGDAATVGGYKCFGGSGTADASGNLTVNFPTAFSSAASVGVSAVSTTNQYVVVTAISASSVTFRAEGRTTGTGVASAGIRWTAIGI